MLFWWWSSVCDAGPPSRQHWLKVCHPSPPTSPQGSDPLSPSVFLCLTWTSKRESWRSLCSTSQGRQAISGKRPSKGGRHPPSGLMWRMSDTSHVQVSAGLEPQLPSHPHFCRLWRSPSHTLCRFIIPLLGVISRAASRRPRLLQARYLRRCLCFAHTGLLGPFPILERVFFLASLYSPVSGQREMPIHDQPVHGSLGAPSTAAITG